MADQRAVQFKMIKVQKMPQNTFSIINQNIPDDIRFQIILSNKSKTWQACCPIRSRSTSLQKGEWFEFRMGEITQIFPAGFRYKLVLIEAILLPKM